MRPGGLMLRNHPEYGALVLAWRSERVRRMPVRLVENDTK